MTTIHLTALPGRYEETIDRPGASKVIEVLGRDFGNTSCEVQGLRGIRSAIKTFGDSIAADHPGVSFYISVRVAKGCRKPNGFDSALNQNQLGNETWMRTITRQPYAPAHAPTHAAT